MTLIEWTRHANYTNIFLRFITIILESSHPLPPLTSGINLGLLSGTGPFVGYKSNSGLFSHKGNANLICIAVKPGPGEYYHIPGYLLWNMDAINAVILSVLQIGSLSLFSVAIFKLCNLLILSWVFKLFLGRRWGPRRKGIGRTAMRFGFRCRYFQPSEGCTKRWKKLFNKWR